MAIDIEIGIARCFCETASRDIDRCYSFHVADIHFIRGDADVRSILFVESVNCACFVSNVCMIIQPEGSEFWEERPGYMRDWVKEDSIDGAGEDESG